MNPEVTSQQSKKKGGQAQKDVVRRASLPDLLLLQLVLCIPLLPLARAAWMGLG